MCSFKERKRERPKSLIILRIEVKRERERENIERKVLQSSGFYAIPMLLLLHWNGLVFKIQLFLVN